MDGIVVDDGSTLMSTKAIQTLQVRLALPSVSRFEDLLEPDARTTERRLKRSKELEGVVHFAHPVQAPPKWVTFVADGVEGDVPNLFNKSTGALLLLRVDSRVFAFPFGQGRHMLKEELLEPDFGFKTALNSIEHTTLRGIDTFTLDDRPFLRRVQTPIAASFQEFGLEIDHDMMRAVVGTPIKSVGFEKVAGADEALSIGVRATIEDLPNVCRRVLKAFKSRAYKTTFPWVDNIQRVAGAGESDRLWQKMIDGLKPGAPGAIFPPEVIDWETHAGFKVTGDNRLRDVVMLDDYTRAQAGKTLTPQILRDHKLKSFDAENDDPVKTWPLYRCINVELREKDVTYVSAGGQWYEVKQDFADTISKRAALFPMSMLKLPAVRVANKKVEEEGRYNERAAGGVAGLAMLDRKLARCHSAASDIEVCDLMSDDNDIIHVKRRKGGSSTLSHLFAQARISSESLVQDEKFRAGARSHLKRLRSSWESRIPARGFDARQFKVVLAFLNCTAAELLTLPFFSKVNMVRAADAIERLGYKVHLLPIPGEK
jgi:uncharacterized protein (TIGR04141 family)